MGLLQVLGKFSPKVELHESKDEMAIGAIVSTMTGWGFLADTFQAGGGRQRIRFRAPADDILDFVGIDLDRATVSTKAKLVVIGEARYALSSPDELIGTWRGVAQQVNAAPVFEDVVLNHRVTALAARTEQTVDLDELVMGESSAQKLAYVLNTAVDKVREGVRRFHR